MSKFCGNCGAVMDDAAAVCGNCGTQFAVAPVQAAPVAQAPVQEAPVYQAPVQTAQAPAEKKFDLNDVADKAVAAVTGVIEGVKKGDKSSFIKVGAVAAAALVAFILIITLIFSGGGEKKVVKKFVKAYDKENASALVKLFPKYTRELAEERDYDLEEMCEDEIADFYDYMLEELDAKKLSFKFKIDDIDEVDEDELEAYADRIKDSIQLIDSDVEFKKAKVTKGCEVEVDVTVKGGGDKDKVDLYLVLIKYSGKWYVIESDWDY